MHLKNYMEDLVWEKLDEVMATQPDMCNCEQCRYDVASLALNYLPSRYVVTATGETYTRVKSLEMQFVIDIISAISRAMIIVQAKPRHPAEK
ncbi:competence protein ComF [Anaerosporomusa subterranea]|jgi:competence protein ComFB|uniref:Competence protein ComF n=1 Tax=Anaerosporomusa subterranea TaxID=1794912 RepID=A0A154BSX5_ANASB|nr:late competence development ComFB family protein [Anaerosporomusa subterranea]KYZ77076.1 competence protein ComF [Anaerosporomusa subterranea]